MTNRRKASTPLTVAALSLAAALAVQAAPALALPTGGAQLAEDEIGESSDHDHRGHPIWCWPLHWFLPCWTQ